MVWRACSIRVQSTESWSKAVTPSAKLYFVRPFPGPLFNLTFNFFSSIESEISEQASRVVVTEEPEKGSSRESRNENPQRGWINYLNGLVSRSNGWVKISNGRANRSNGWINYLNGLISRSNGLLSRPQNDRGVADEFSVIPFLALFGVQIAWREKPKTLKQTLLVTIWMFSR